MSLTHYWHRPTELDGRQFTGAVGDFERVLSHIDIELAGFEGMGDIIMSAERLVFNGLSPQCCEPFEIANVEFDRRGREIVFSYCKTQGLPYDRAVQVALIIFNYHYPDDFVVSSDADDSAWDNARQLIQSTLGYGLGFELTASGQ